MGLQRRGTTQRLESAGSAAAPGAYWAFPRQRLTFSGVPKAHRHLRTSPAWGPVVPIDAAKDIGVEQIRDMDSRRARPTPARATRDLALRGEAKHVLSEVGQALLEV